MEDRPLSVRFEDVDGRMFGGCIQAVSGCNGYSPAGGPEVWGGPAL